tara:strand:+ start:564 stop:932 length:369 start_codon:yes stop_codon:yes gene_type:complete
MGPIQLGSKIMNTKTTTDGCVEIVHDSDAIYAATTWDRTFIGERSNVQAEIENTISSLAYSDLDWVMTSVFDGGSWDTSDHQSPGDILDHYEDAPAVTREDIFALFQTDSVTDELITIRRIA